MAMVIQFMKYLYVPMFPQSGDNTLLNWASTCATNWYTHTVMATQAVQLVHIVGGITGAVLDFSGRRIQFNPTRGTIEMVPMINFTTETQRILINHATVNRISPLNRTLTISKQYLLALLADMFS